jgi:hypothetical protein
MTKSTKRWALLFLGFTIVAMLLLSVSLPSLRFQPGQPFSLGNSQPPPGVTSGLEMPSDFFLIFIRGLLALVLLIVPVYIIFHLLTPEGRRKLLGDLVVILLFFAAAEFLSRLSREAPIPQQQPSGEQGGLTLPTPGPIAAFTAQSTPALEIAVIIAIALIFAIGIGVLYWYYRRRQEQNFEATPLEQLANEAQQAVDALMAGEDIKDIVIRSYIQMSRVLWQEREIKRDEVMTPHEFEESLVKKGLPYDPVHQLTRLFEEARYGAKQPGRLEEQRAIDCLSTIVEFCKKPESSG